MAAPKRKQKPASDPDAREKQMINLAVELAEKQLRDGTASASTINHYLKLASSRDALEREKLQKELTLISAKAEAITSAKDTKEITEAALEAMRNYSKGR